MGPFTTLRVISFAFYAVGLIYKEVTVLFADVAFTAFIASIIGAAIVLLGGMEKKTA